MERNQPFVHIHADESCLGNQFKGRDRPGGAAALLEHWTGRVWERRDVWTSDPSTTNNRMALVSAILPLGVLRERCRVRFVSDSQYLVKGASEWMPGWKQRGWKRKGGPIENVDLWRRLDSTLARHDVSWEWVKGHAGDPRNEYVNVLAQRAAGELSETPGPVPSGFVEWLESERESDRYLDYFEFAPPESSTKP
ncbi:MAG: ribonuclease HI [Gemmatimonadota bacterium]|nr:ribonuclease HI [Gemmatimonadota bacterium]MDE2864819.1 ribonuclease HI [Gemmatimonadota bacterium]